MQVLVAVGQVWGAVAPLQRGGAAEWRGATTMRSKQSGSKSLCSRLLGSRQHVAVRRLQASTQRKLQSSRLQCRTPPAEEKNLLL